MAKLYEILMRKIRGVVKDANEQQLQESKIWNPIGARVGSSITIDCLDYRGLNFFVREIREFTVQLAGKKHRFVDYVLLARPLEGEDVWARLRLVPDTDSGSLLTHKSVVLSLYDEFAYNQEFKDNVLLNETKEFIVTNPDETEEKYWRVNDVSQSYNTKYVSLIDENHDGKVSEDELSHGEIEFWDYNRLTEIDGVEMEQFLFVEMNKDDGWFQLWRGSEVPAEQVTAN